MSELDQLGLYDATKTRHEEMLEKFLEFNQAHPEVWVMFRKYTIQMINRGYQHYSAMAVVQRIRWEIDAGGDGVAEFKINNNHVPFYARAFMRLHPEHDGFFRTREQPSEKAAATNLPPLTPADYPEIALQA